MSEDLLRGWSTGTRVAVPRVVADRALSPLGHWPLAVLLVTGLLLPPGSPIELGVPEISVLLAALAAYVVADRWGCWRWLAATATAPALLGTHLLEDVNLTGSVALVLVSAAVVVLCWRDRSGAAWGYLAAALAVAVVAGGVAWLQEVALGVGSPPFPGPTLTTCIAAGGVLAAAAVAGLGRADAVPGMRLACLLMLLLPVPVAAAAGSVGLPTIVWWPAAGVVGLTAVLRGRRGRGTGPGEPPYGLADEEALAAFRARYGAVRLAPVTIVIAAYNEAPGLPGVLSDLPIRVCGLPTDVLVVDDGSTDGTAQAAAGTRAMVAVRPVNGGQGTALRLGYRIAREHGARFLVTTDADGQYSAGDLDSVLAPILTGRADFVTGSRILGHQHTRDRVRRAGVHLFAWLVTVLTCHRVTDTSFGLRAMRAEVTEAVTLAQPQYQSSELLIGVLSRGFRACEVPATMHVRTAGASKKGRNLVYGYRYARVVLGTWWREGLHRPVPEFAEALRREPDA